jgi:titin
MPASPLRGPVRIRSRQRAICWRPALEVLESRVLPSNYVVSSTADSGPGTLRDAVTRVNADASPDSISFGIAGSGAQTIQPLSALPTITNAVIIDGTTQTGYAGKPLIVLNGSLAGSGTSGLVVAAGNTTIKGLVVNGFSGDGIDIQYSSNVTIQANYIGTDVTGTAKVGNSQTGLLLKAGAQSALIGSNGDNVNDAAEANLISGNGFSGIYLTGSNTSQNTIAGNRIGTDITGTKPLGNGYDGITVVSGSHANRIGTNGTDADPAGERNIISANGLRGVSIFNPPTQFNVIAGNYIGTDITGTKALGNTYDGVFIVNGSSNNRVGTNGDGQGDLAERNVIAANGGAGVFISDGATIFNIVAGNFIGTDVTGTQPLGNANDGVEVTNGAQNNRVGANVSDVDPVGERNVIANNHWDGVGLYGSGTFQNIAAGNYIGTDASGAVALGNSDWGVRITGGASANRIGVSAGSPNPAAERNIIAANGFDGLQITDSGSDQNVVAGNYIGTNASGTAKLGNTYQGVAIVSAAANNTIGGTTAAARNLLSGNGQRGLFLADPDTSGNIAEGNFIGTDVTGTAPLGNASDGIGFFNGASDNVIGGSTPGSGNVIAANGYQGIYVQDAGTTQNVVAGNFIGTTVNGTVALANGVAGVFLNYGASGNTIGGTTTSARNIISGNLGDGVAIQNDGNQIGTFGNVVAGNYIGTDASGTVALGNGGEGVHIDFGAVNNTIGGTVLGAGNVISSNLLRGIRIAGTGTSGNLVEGNNIGTNAAGTSPLGNASDGVRFDFGASGNTLGGPGPGAGNLIMGNGGNGVTIWIDGTIDDRVQGNSIFANGSLSIDLGNDGPSYNDVGDLEGGPNNSQNYPVLVSGTPGPTTTFSGTLNSRANQTFTIDFYASAMRDTSSFGPGQRYLGSTTTTTDASGNASFTAVLAAATNVGDWATATATDASGDTSEFSSARQLPTLNANLSFATWQPIGPAPINTGFPVAGRITGVAGDPTNANVIYVAGAFGGVWKTINGGTSWSPVTDPQVIDSMGAIALAPSSPTTIYAGTGEANNSGDSYYGRGVLKSADGGATWTLLGAPLFDRRTISKIVVHPTDPNTVYLAVSGGGVNGLGNNTGIWKSTDGGLTWIDTTTAISTFASFSDLVMDPSNSQILYAAVGSSGGDPTNSVYKTTNGGTSWALAGNIPTGTGDGRIALAIAKTNALEVFAAIASPFTGGLGEMMKSTNGGATWVRMTNTPNYMSNQGWYDTTLAVDPANASVVYAGGSSNGGGPGMIESTDGGNSWTAIDQGVTSAGEHTDKHAIGFDANGKLLDGNDGGIWRLDVSTPGNIHWANLNGNLQITQFTGIALNPSATSTIYGGTQDNGTDKSTGALTWTQIRGGDGGFVRVDFSHPTTVYHTYTYVSVERSDDGGVTWAAKTTGISLGDPTDFYTPYVMDPANSSRLLLGTNRVYETTNRGDLWAPISTPFANGWTTNATIDALAVAKSNPSTVYALAGGHVFVTFNDGGSWQQVDIPGYSYHFADVEVDPTNNQVAYVMRDVFGGGHVFRTTNGGATWLDITGNLPDVPANALAIDSRTNVLYVGTDVGVYASNDLGTNWARLGSGLPDSRVIGLEVNAASNLLAVGTHGRGAWEISLAHLGVTASSSSVAAGVPVSVTVAELDPFGSALPDYRGTIHFSSSDAQAILPGDYTFTAADSGVHTFSNGVVLKIAGNQTITAADISTLALTSAAALTVNAAIAAQLIISAPAGSTAGTAFTMTVTALDAYGNIAAGYTGKVHFSSSDGQAMLPLDYTFTSTDGGVHTFVNQVTLKTAGSQTITATDTSTPWIGNHGTLHGGQTITASHKTTNLITGSATVVVSTGAARPFPFLVPEQASADKTLTLLTESADNFGSMVIDTLPRGTAIFTVTGHAGLMRSVVAGPVDHHGTSNSWAALVDDYFAVIPGDKKPSRKVGRVFNLPHVSR